MLADAAITKANSLAAEVADALEQDAYVVVSTRRLKRKTDVDSLCDGVKALRFVHTEQVGDEDIQTAQLSDAAISNDMPTVDEVDVAMKDADDGLDEACVLPLQEEEDTRNDITHTPRT